MKVKHFPLSYKAFPFRTRRKTLCLQGFSAMSALPDGSYDALVIDAVAHNDGTATIEVTVTSGPHRGDVVRVRSLARETDPFSLLGLPVVLTVVDGEPRLRRG